VGEEIVQILSGLAPLGGISATALVGVYVLLVMLGKVPTPGMVTLLKEQVLSKDAEIDRWRTAWENINTAQLETSKQLEKLVEKTDIAASRDELFCLLYTWWKNWWRVDVSRHIFFLMLGLAGLINLSLLRRTVGEFLGYDFLVLVVYCLICYQLYRRLWFLVKYNSPWGERTMDRRAVRIERERTEGIERLKEKESK
jgi:hypothetical protein